MIGPIEDDRSTVVKAPRHHTEAEEGPCAREHLDDVDAIDLVVIELHGHLSRVKRSTEASMTPFNGVERSLDSRLAAKSST